ncbi:hypothetical protein ACQCRO_27930, partial [Ralstonia pseudosolanacearum]|uniref:hypothetical protein n=1 Tax=Ralstonia pseudosolanacearum TaxID=1310165 RepID=UPI003CFA2839
MQTEAQLVLLTHRPLNLRLFDSHVLASATLGPNPVAMRSNTTNITENMRMVLFIFSSKEDKRVG